MRRHKDQAAAFLAKGKKKQALKEYRLALEYAPGDVALRQKLADLLVRLDHKEAAIREYQGVAGKYAADGFLVKAMAICKVILKLDPNHTETQEALANLYAEQSPQGVLPASMTAALAGPSLRITPASEPQPRKPARAVVPAMSMPSAMPAVAMDELDEMPLARARTGIDFPAVSAPEAPAPVPASAEEIGLVALPGRIVHAPEPAEQTEVVADEAETLDQDAEDDPDTLVLGLFGDAGVAPEEPTQPAAEYFDLIDDGNGDDDDDDEGVGGREMSSGEVDILVKGQSDTEEMAVDISRFPPIPLFHDLDKRAFVAMFDRLDIKSVGPGERLIEEGATTTSMFIVAQGEVRVFRKKDGAVELARLTDGSFFGEIALLSDAPRMASVESTKPTLLFEMTREHVAELIRMYPSVSDVLGKFYRARFLANLVRSNPLLFQPLSDEEKREVFEHFQSVTVPPETVILRKGEMGEGLYLILRGECDVVDAAEDGRLFHLPVLREGDFFGEMSLLLGVAVNATVRARTTCTVLRLPREIFYERVMRHPEVRRVITTTTNERLKQAASIETAHSKTDPVLV